ncbi:hypothetical protein KPATCC21470_6338 [Kitasatospora purpeofusca]
MISSSQCGHDASAIRGGASGTAGPGPPRDVRPSVGWWRALPEHPRGLGRASGWVGGAALRGGPVAHRGPRGS